MHSAYLIVAPQWHFFVGVLSQDQSGKRLCTRIFFLRSRRACFLWCFFLVFFVILLNADWLMCGDQCKICVKGFCNWNALHCFARLGRNFVKRWTLPQRDLSCLFVDDDFYHPLWIHSCWLLAPHSFGWFRASLVICGLTNWHLLEFIARFSLSNISMKSKKSSFCFFEFHLLSQFKVWEVRCSTPTSVAVSVFNYVCHSFSGESCWTAWSHQHPVLSVCIVNKEFGRGCWSWLSGFLGIICSLFSRLPNTTRLGQHRCLGRRRWLIDLVFSDPPCLISIVLQCGLCFRHLSENIWRSDLARYSVYMFAIMRDILPWVCRFADECAAPLVDPPVAEDYCAWEMCLRWIVRVWSVLQSKLLRVRWCFCNVSLACFWLHVQCWRLTSMLSQTWLLFLVAPSRFQISRFGREHISADCLPWFLIANWQCSVRALRAE